MEAYKTTHRVFCMLGVTRLWYRKSPEKQGKMGREGVEPSLDFSKRILSPSRALPSCPTCPNQLVFPAFQILLLAATLLFLTGKLHLSYTKQGLDASPHWCSDYHKSRARLEKVRIRPCLSV